VVGGLLVAVAAVVTFASAGGAGRGPAGRYVVAARDVVPGAELAAADLRVVAVDLPPGQRAVSFTDVAVLEGAVSLGALRAGQFVQSSDVAAAGGGAGRVQLSVPVDRANAMEGSTRYLRGGERVDVVATERSGTTLTRTVARDCEVVEVLGGDGGTSRLTVVLAVDPDDAEPLAGAAAVATLTLVRTTGRAG
jgi:Flp pilus assembly protein CpaB